MRPASALTTASQDHTCTNSHKKRAFDSTLSLSEANFVRYVIGTYAVHNVTMEFWPPRTYGRHSSLYKDLGENDIKLLEKAIFLRMVGDFAQSINILEKWPSPAKYHPAVVLEHGVTLCNQLRYQTAASVFRDALSHVQREDRLLGPDPNAYQLIRMWFGKTQIYSAGKLEEAWEAMKEVRGSLQHVSVESSLPDAV